MGILDFISQLFKSKEKQALPKPEEANTIFEELQKFGKEIETELNIDELIINSENIKQLPRLKTKFSREQIINIATRFYESLGIKEDINIDTTVKHGDINYLVQAVNRVSQRFSKIETSDEYSKVIPKCMEKIFENYLKSLSDDECIELKINKEEIKHDVILRNITETLKLKKDLINPNSINIKHILGKFYATKFDEICNRNQLNKDGQIRLLLQTIRDIKSNQKKILESDKSNIMQLRSLESGVIQYTKNKINQFVLNNKIEKIMNQIEMNQNVIENIMGQELYINLKTEIPFILLIPDQIKEKATLIMESNNLETNNKQKLFSQGLETARSLSELSKGQNPIIVPILSSDKNDQYWQQLSAECFEKDRNFNAKMLETIEKSKEIIKQKKNIELNEKIFLNGYSSSGVFAQRFSLINPEIIDTACIGGASGSIPVPDTRLDYPLGVKNYEELFNKPFNIEAYKNINFEYYVGSLESYVKSNRNGIIAPMHDMSYFAISVPTEIGKQQRKLFGYEMFERAQKTIETLKEQGVKINHNILYNCIHNDKEAEKYNKENLGVPIVTGVREERDKIIKTTIREMNERQKNKEKEEKNIPN